MKAVFVSYKTKDRDRVRLIVEGLRGLDIVVWWDVDIPPGADWEACITQALDDAGCVIVCWTEAAVHSNDGANVQVEAREALKRGKLVQAYLDAIEAPLFFRQKQGVQLTDWRGDIADRSFQSLARGVRDTLAGKAWSPQPKRKLALAGAGRWFGFALVLALGAASVVWGDANRDGSRDEVALSVQIVSPADGATVAPIGTVTGTVSDPNAEVWLLLAPAAAQECWVQSKAYVRGRDWIVDAHFGETGDEGSRYTMRAIANPDGELRPGPTENCWPSARAMSAPVLNLVRGPSS